MASSMSFSSLWCVIATLLVVVSELTTPVSSFVVPVVMPPATATAAVAARKAASASSTTALQAAESEVSFGTLNGAQMRIGIIRTRWNEEHVNNLVTGIRQALKECNVTEDNIFETSVPGSFELPVAARFLALSRTVDAIIATGVLIKGNTMHFEFISQAVASGLMSTALQTSTPVVFGVLTCNNEQQVKDRSTGKNNHGYDWGKTAVEMALLRTEALGGKVGEESAALLQAMGFGAGAGAAAPGEKKKSAFF